MLFNSVEFLLFFPIVTALYFLLPLSYRWPLLLVASCFFYMFFKPVYILILLATIVVDYYAGILIENTTNKRQKRNYLIMSLVANIGVLAVFKYYNFINDNITGIASLMGMHNPIPALRMLLPIGLSFHTFQAMSYTIEVYRGNQKAERHFGLYSLYVMFYPQLVAGPIERPQNILHQFKVKHQFSYANAVQGLNLMVYGLFKKVVIADRLGVYVDHVYAAPTAASSIAVLLAICFFSIQLYCDFSGYSDIARGAALFMGFHLMTNFNRPFLSVTTAEFWSRWHISLGTWFRDYVYLPLGGNRRGNLISFRNIMIVFLISGLWHGANWTFVVWGGLQGLYIVIGHITQKARRAAADAIGITKFVWFDRLVNQLTVFALIAFARIFFRSETFDKAWLVMHKAFSGPYNWNIGQITADYGPFSLLLDFTFVGLLLLSYRLPSDLKLKRSYPFLVATLLLILFFGENGKAAFIYFQF